MDSCVFARLERYLLYCLVPIAVLTPPFWHHDHGYSADLQMTAVVQTGVLAVLVLFFVGRLRSGLLVARSSISLPFVAFVSWVALSLFWAHNRYEATVQVMQWGAGLIFFFLVANALRSQCHTVTLLAYLFYTGFAVALIGLCQFRFGLTWIPQHIPPAASFGNKNMAAHFVVFTIPLGLGIYSRLGSGSRFWRYGVIGVPIVCQVVYVVCTRTRAAWIALFIEATLIFAWLICSRVIRKDGAVSRKPRFVETVCLLFAIVIIVSLGGSRINEKLIGTIQTTVREAGINHDANPRIRWWLASVRMIVDRPVKGVGVGNWYVQYPFYGDRIRLPASSDTGDIALRDPSEYTAPLRAHNDYLQIMVELGVVGFALFSLLLVYTCRPLTQVRKVRPESAILIISVLVSFAGILITAIFSFPLQLMIPVAVFAIYAAALRNLTGDSGSSHPFVLPKQFIPICLAVAALLLVVVSIVNFRTYKADSHYYRAYDAMQAGDLTASISEARIAHQYRPDHDLLLHGFGFGSLQLSDYPQAAEVFVKILESYPYMASALDHLSTAYLKMNQLDAAVDAIESWLGIRPDSRRAREKIAQVYSEIAKKRSNEGDWDGTLEAFKIASEYLPGKFSYHYNVGTSAFKAGRHQEAREVWLDVLTHWPQSSVVHNSLAILNFRYLDNKSVAVEHMKEALKLDPNLESTPATRAIREYEASRQKIEPYTAR